jgi:hypothetical protein
LTNGAALADLAPNFFKLTRLESLSVAQLLHEDEPMTDLQRIIH